jgi:endonuclease/exonuclease/phosphatase (EEP) superfamily protein YafD
MDRRFWTLSMNFRGLLGVAAAMACVCTFTGFAGDLWWPFELTSHFRAQYLVVLVLSAAVYCFSGRYAAASVTTVCALINLSLILPLYFGPPADSGKKACSRAVMMNVSRENEEYRKVGEFIHSASPDFIVADEVTWIWLEKLKEVLTDYQYSKELPREDEFGIALFSRIPLRDAQLVKIGGLDFRAVKAVMTIEGKNLTVIGVHPPPPVGQIYREERIRYLKDLSAIVSSSNRPVMVLGDLNTTSWSPIFQNFVKKTDLLDSRKGFGIQPTWPDLFPPLWIPLDHCLISTGFTIRNRKVGPNIGSDHYPIIVDFSMD